jgi:hypothetical protein
MLSGKGSLLSIPLFSQQKLPPKRREDKSPSVSEGLLSLMSRKGNFENQEYTLVFTSCKFVLARASLIDNDSGM